MIDERKNVQTTPNRTMCKHSRPLSYYNTKLAGRSGTGSLPSTIAPPDLFSILFYPITLEGRRGTTDEFATIHFHLDMFSAALVELAKSIPVHSLILSSHLFFCLPLFLFLFTVPCRIVFAKPEDLETWPNHLSVRFLTRVRSSSYSPMAAWIFLRTSSLVTWSLYEMFNSPR